MITILIIAVTVGASFYAWRKPDLYRKWVMNPFMVNKHNEYFRFLTSGFIHADQAHLLINMFVFFSFGLSLEKGFFTGLFGESGRLFYLLFYLLAVIVSEIPTFVKHKGDSWYNSLGASGAVSAVVFGNVMIAPFRDIYFFFIPIPGILYGVLFLVYSFYSSKRQGGYINHDAHFYGAVFGIVTVVVLEPAIATQFLQQLAGLLSR
jgi:membrane associated rhomboid family serine protease